jgi:hypothetical protein
MGDQMARLGTEVDEKSLYRFFEEILPLSGQRQSDFLLDFIAGLSKNRNMALITRFAQRCRDPTNASLHKLDKDTFDDFLHCLVYSARMDVLTSFPDLFGSLQLEYNKIFRDFLRDGSIPQVDFMLRHNLIREEDLLNFPVASLDEEDIDGVNELSEVVRIADGRFVLL